ncbi:MAG: cupin-like domain-containing protein [Bacteriovoracaceae bacterium]|jgi:hypothetical protein|nr:cupin-like domain-containing protein [Bacteriovoracaceae bacterium]
MIPHIKYRAAYSFFRLLEHFAPFTKKFCLKQKKYISTKAYQNIQGHTGKRIEVKRVKNITLKELKKNYINKGIPVVLEGFAKNWPALDHWQPQKLKNRFGSDTAKIFEANLENQLTYDVKESNLTEVFEAMEKEDSSKYCRFNRLLYDHPELLNDFDNKWLYKTRCLLSSGKTFQVFLGAINSVTSLHSASEHNIFTQVYGQKHWYIIDSRYDVLLDPPVNGTPYFYSDLNPDKVDNDNLAYFKHIDVMETTLNPGDILFNPPSFWHQVTNKSSSIGVGFRWFGIIDCFRFNFAATILTIFAKNPPIWIAKKYRTDFAKIFEYMNKKNQ